MTDGMTRAFMGEKDPSGKGRPYIPAGGVIDEGDDNITTGIEAAPQASYTSERRDPKWGEGEQPSLRNQDGMLDAEEKAWREEEREFELI